MPEYHEDKPRSGKDWFFNTFSPFDGDVQSRFLFYGTGGLMDPKNYTMEPYVLSGAGNPRFWQWDKARWSSFGRGFLRSQAIAFLGVGLLGAVFDPLGIDDTGGMDEVWGDIYDWGVPEDHGVSLAKETLTTMLSNEGKARYYNPTPGFGFL